MRACPAVLVLPSICSPHIFAPCRWIDLPRRGSEDTVTACVDAFLLGDACLLAYLVVAWVDAFTPLISCRTPPHPPRLPSKHHLGHRGESNVCVGVPAWRPLWAGPISQARAESLSAHCGHHGRQVLGSQSCWAGDLALVTASVMEKRGAGGVSRFVFCHRPSEVSAAKATGQQHRPYQLTTCVREDEEQRLGTQPHIVVAAILPSGLDQLLRCYSDTSYSQMGGQLERARVHPGSIRSLFSRCLSTRTTKHFSAQAWSGMCLCSKPGAHAMRPTLQGRTASREPSEPPF